VIEPELPFNIVVLTNLSGQPPAPLPKVKERRLISVSRNSFPALLASLKPQISVDNKQVFIKEVSCPSYEGIVAQLVNGGASSEEAGLLAHRVMGMPDFMTLYASWRNLLFLIESVTELTEAMVHVWNVSKKELLKDLQRAPEFDQTALFKRVYEEGVGTFGADPVSLIILDFDITNRPEDLEILEKVSQVGSASATPVLIRMVPEFLDLNSWKGLNVDLRPKLLNAAARRAKWRGFRESSECSVFAFLQDVDETAVSNGQMAAPISPIFAAGAAAARVFQGEYAGEPTAESVDGQCDESDRAAEDSVAVNLQAMGLNKIPTNASELELLRAVHARTPGFANHPQSLRMVLGANRIWHMLRVVLRNKSHSLPQQVSALQELVQSSKRIKRFTSLNNGQVALVENDGLLALTFEFPKIDSLELSVHRAKCSKQAPTTDDHTPHTRVLADYLTKGERPRPKVPDRRPMLSEGWGRHIHCDLSVGRPGAGKNNKDDLTLRFSDLDLRAFSPQGLARQIRVCQQPLLDKDDLLELASFADERTGGWSVLEYARQRPDGVRALGSLLEAWISITSNQDLSPVPAKLISERLGSWISANSSTLEWIGRRLPTYQKWIAAKPYCSDSVRFLEDVLDDIENLIDAQLRPIYFSAEFCTIERTWRGLSWLAGAAKNSIVSAFELDWYSERVSKIVGTIRTDWEISRVVLGTEGRSTDPKCVDIVVVDYCLRLEDSIDLLRLFADLWREEQLVAICSFVSDQDCHAYFSDSAVEGIATTPWGRGLVLVSGDFEFEGEPAERIQPWLEGGSATRPVYRASAVYAVAAAVGEVLRDFVAEDDAQARSILLNARLLVHGLTCQPLGNAMIVSPQAVGATIG
jgi:predicted component of type VI protein secretion system